ncbi:MAG: MBL fold metallo-hydrolase [Lachnospiraceae bacterium]|nr:MBL fold metallo-hydrolase [Lachnospiraceae bacterium]
MKIAEKIYLLSGMSYGLLGNVYGIVHRDGLLLVDCGRPHEAIPMIERNLRVWGLEKLPVTALLVTHGHPDHCGNGFYFQQQGATVVAGQKDADQILRLGDYDPVIFPCVLHDFEEDCLFEPYEVDIKVESDIHLSICEYDIEVLTTPGHTQGSVVYIITIKNKKYFFTGDTLSAEGSRAHVPVLGTAASVDYCAQSYISSMQKLLNRYPDAILGGHGIPRLVSSNAFVAQACMKAMKERS